MFKKNCKTLDYIESLPNTSVGSKTISIPWPIKFTSEGQQLKLWLVGKYSMAPLISFWKKIGKLFFHD